MLEELSHVILLQSELAQEMGTGLLILCLVLMGRYITIHHSARRAKCVVRRLRWREATQRFGYLHRLRVTNHTD